jgi:hypothetical protein
MGEEEEWREEGHGKRTLEKDKGSGEQAYLCAHYQFLQHAHSLCRPGQQLQKPRSIHRDLQVVWGEEMRLQGMGGGWTVGLVLSHRSTILPS